MVLVGARDDARPRPVAVDVAVAFPVPAGVTLRPLTPPRPGIGTRGRSASFSSAASAATSVPSAPPLKLAPPSLAGSTRSTAPPLSAASAASVSPRSTPSCPTPRPCASTDHPAKPPPYAALPAPVKKPIVLLARRAHPGAAAWQPVECSKLPIEVLPAPGGSSVASALVPPPLANRPRVAEVLSEGAGSGCIVVAAAATRPAMVEVLVQSPSASDTSQPPAFAHEREERCAPPPQVEFPIPCARPCQIANASPLADSALPLFCAPRFVSTATTSSAPYSDPRSTDSQHDGFPSMVTSSSVDVSVTGPECSALSGASSASQRTHASPSPSAAGERRAPCRHEIFSSPSSWLQQVLLDSEADEAEESSFEIEEELCKLLEGAAHVKPVSAEPVPLTHEMALACAALGRELAALDDHLNWAEAHFFGSEASNTGAADGTGAAVERSLCLAPSLARLLEEVEAENQVPSPDCAVPALAS